MIQPLGELFLRNYLRQLNKFKTFKREIPKSLPYEKVDVLIEDKPAMLLNEPVYLYTIEQ